jgi:hypothetical protein
MSILTVIYRIIDYNKQVHYNELDSILDNIRHDDTESGDIDNSTNINMMRMGERSINTGNNYSKIDRMTQAEYDLLSEEEKHSGKVFYITDPYALVYDDRNISTIEEPNHEYKLVENVCKNCGAPLVIKGNSCKCEYCGSTYSLVDVND